MDLYPNLTELNTSNATPAASGSVLANSCIVVLSLFNTGLAIVAVIILYKCRRMSFQVKRLSYNIFLTDAALNVIMLGLSAAVLGADSHTYSALRVIRVGIVITALLVSLASVAGLTLDRLYALTRPYSYIAVMNEKRITMITVFVWIVNTVIPLSVFVVTVKITCNFDVMSPDCDRDFIPFRILIAVFYVIYHTFIICSYTQISKLTKIHVSAIMRQTSISNQPGQEMSMPPTYTIAKMLLAFELTQFPVLVHTIFFLLFPSLKQESFSIMFHILSYVCSCGNLYICFCLYVWMMQECRFVFLKTFLSWNEGFRKMAEEMRLEVYDIVPCRNSASSKTSQTSRLSKSTFRLDSRINDNKTGRPANSIYVIPVDPHPRV